VPTLLNVLAGVVGKVCRDRRRCGAGPINDGSEEQLTAGARSLDHRGGLPRREWCDPARKSLVGAFGVVDVVERIDLGLQLGQGVGERLLVEVAEECLVEAFVLALGGGLVRLAGDRLDAEGHDVDDGLAQDPAS
jgi:hypothetical protein